MMNNTVLHECLTAALEGRMPFPESVMRMAAVGVERYRADLTRMMKTHYNAAGESHTETIRLEGAPAIASAFSPEEVKSAIAAIQQRKIEYPEFLRRCMDAGVTEYLVSIPGRRAVYTGRSGEFHVEHFPAPAAQ